MSAIALEPDAGGTAAAERAVVFLLARLAERPRSATARALVHHLAVLVEDAPAAALPPARRMRYARLLACWRGELAWLWDGPRRRPGTHPADHARGPDDV